MSFTNIDNHRGFKESNSVPKARQITRFVVGSVTDMKSWGIYE